jgi:selenocysteine lyase/cysteine desulfurase
MATDRSSAMSGASATNCTSPINWAELSRQFLLDKSLTYLNTGSFGAMPKPVLAARRAAEERLESNPVGEGYGPLLKDAEAVAARVARFIGCHRKEVTITRNTTEGVDFVAEGCNLQPGQRVVTSNNEHGGGLGAWNFLKKHRGIELDVAEIGSPPRSEDEIVESFQKQIKAQTRVVFCSHVTFSNGVTMPIARLSSLAHKHNCLMVVDGAQSLGGIAVNVRELGCDAFAASGHKYLLAPKGTGILYVSKQAKDRIKPMQLDDGYGYYTAIRGANSIPDAIGLGAAIQWFEDIGPKAVFERLAFLRNSLYLVLQATPGIKINSPPPGSSMASHLVCFTVIDRVPFTSRANLDEQFDWDKIVVKHVGLQRCQTNPRPTPSRCRPCCPRRGACRRG